MVASKKNGLEVNADKNKYMIMYWDQNAGWNHNIKIDYSFFEKVEKLQYFGTTYTDQNSIQEEIKSNLKSGNTCYHSVQNPLYSNLLSKNIKINIYRTKILPVLLYRCDLVAQTERGT